MRRLPLGAGTIARRERPETPAGETQVTRETSPEKHSPSRREPPPDPPTPTSSTSRLLGNAPIAAVLAVAAVLLGWRLGAVYLWQDEAATAVMAERMLQYGRPLAWDGRNLITMDTYVEENPHGLAARTGDPAPAIQYYAARGDFRPDGTWVNHPWGQFVAAAASLALLGHGTFAARAPFALAALGTVLLLYLLVRRTFEDRWVATAAPALLVANAYWILHARQCRYYALSSLMVVASVAAFERWQRGGRWGAALFVLCGWLLFHCDFGTFFPIMGVLALVAAASAWPGLGRPVGVFAALGAAVAPFAWYYGILDRLRRPFSSLLGRAMGNLFNVNQYLIAAPLLLLAVWLAWRHRAELAPAQRRVLWTAIGILLAMLAWVPVVAPWPFHRYVVQLAPLACLLTAWTVAQIAAPLAERVRAPWAKAAVASGLAVFVAVSGLLSAPVALALNWLKQPVHLLGRPEVGTMLSEIFLERVDPNRAIVETIAPMLRDGDEILVNYEDIPLMFYTRARVRGGIPAFRVEDHSGPPPRFLVLRRSVPFVHWKAFEREWERYAWREIPVDAPDLPWGDNPDPSAMPLPPTAMRVVVAERVGP